MIFLVHLCIHFLELHAQKIRRMTTRYIIVKEINRSGEKRRNCDLVSQFFLSSSDLINKISKMFIVFFFSPHLVLILWIWTHLLFNTYSNPLIKQLLNETSLVFLFDYLFFPSLRSFLFVGPNKGFLLVKHILILVQKSH